MANEWSGVERPIRRRIGAPTYSALVGWVNTELVLVALAAMLSPTTLTFSVLALVVAERPLRTGIYFYLGAVLATTVVGVIAAFVIGDAAASDTSSPKTWVAIIDIVLAVFLLVLVVRAARRPADPRRTAGMMDQMQKVTASPAIAIFAAGATLANPGGFIPIALKTISETDPTAPVYIVEWLFFTIVSLLPLAVAIVMLLLAPDPTMRRLERVRGWLERNARVVAFVIVVLLAVALLRNGIAGLTS
jgi:threonine/homoserine/homoserine lactone efflux protein